MLTRFLNLVISFALMRPGREVVVSGCTASSGGLAHVGLWRMERFVGAADWRAMRRASQLNTGISKDFGARQIRAD